MDLITVDTSACQRDGMCMEVCPVGCIETDADGFPRPAPDATCIACGHCVAVCPHGALSNVNVDAGACRPAPRNLPGEESVRALMLTRRSVRAYKDKPVDPAVLAGLLDTARYAPTAVNTQHVSWVACADPAKVRQAAGLCMEWLRGAGIYPKMVEAWDKGHDAALRGAPAFVVAHCPADYAWGDVDCTIALSYLELAAASAGLGTCWAGLLTRAAQASPALSALLGIPEGRTAKGGLMIGHAKYRYRLIPPRNEARISWV